MIRHICLLLAIFAASLLLACGSYAPAGDESDFPPFPDIPGMDSAVWEPVPYADLDRLFDGFGRTFSSKGFYDIQGEKDLETDEPASAVLSHYRSQLAHPSWNIQSESLENPVPWIIWTVRDGKGNLWFGTLVAAAAGEGRVKVWLSLYSDDWR